MKKLLLSVIFVFLCGFLSAQNLVSADSIFNKIRIETVKGANTASRVGTAGQYVVDGVRDTLSNFATTIGTNALINDTLIYYNTANQTKALISDSLDLAVRLLGNQTINGAKRFTTKIQFDASADQTVGGDVLGVALKNAGGLVSLTNDTIILATDYESIMLFTKDSIIPKKPIKGFISRQEIENIVSDSLAGVVTTANPQLITGLKTFQNGINTRIVDENELSVFGGDQFYTAIQSGGNELISAFATGEVLVYDSVGNPTIWCKEDTIRLYKPIILKDTATVFDDLFFPFETGESGSSGFPTFVPDSLYYTFVVDSTGPSQCKKYFNVQMPHRWKAGTVIYPHVHYKYETAVGTPKFKLKYKWANTNKKTGGWKWYPMEQTTGTTNGTVQMSYNSAGGISGAGKELSSILLIQLYLSGNPTNVNAYQFDIHIEIDKLGTNDVTQ